MAGTREWTGREVRALRDALGMSPRELGSRLNVSERVISKWEASPGEAIPRDDKRAMLGKLLGRVPEEARDRFRDFLAAQEQTPGTAGAQAPSQPEDLYGIAMPYMDRRGLSIRALAKAIYQDPGLVSKTLHGKKPCGPALARAIDAAIGAEGEFMKAAHREAVAASRPAPPAADGAASQSEAPNGTSRASMNSLINRMQWTRDDLSALSLSIDSAISRSDVADIELLAHAWLSADSPQLIELNSGRRISDSLISAVEHRVVQLRRVDDYTSSRTSRALVREEISATTRLLSDAILPEVQMRRLLTATAELSQLAALVSADAGFSQEAANYCEGGILAAHAAGNAPLVAHIVSTLGYQMASHGDPREAAILARTAYAGGRREASATAKALLLDRIAWADAKSGDLNSCDRSLGLAEENFANSDPGSEPDWVYWVSKAEIDIMAGRCFTELRQPARAEPLLRNAISGYDSTHVREVSLYRSWLAEDYILLKDIDAATVNAMQVLELGIRANSARTDERLRHLASLLAHYKGIQDVTEFLDRHKEYTHQ